MNKEIYYTNKTRHHYVYGLQWFMNTYGLTLKAAQLTTRQYGYRWSAMSDLAKAVVINQAKKAGNQ